MTSTAARPRVLCVDDEPMVLAGLVDTLRKRFDVTTAEGGSAGLRALGGARPFAVIVSDFMMPGMNGAEFLSVARVAAPDAVRILLTGQASMENAVAVVNEGNIFRFLTKPCAPADLLRALDDAVEQSRLLTADHELMEHKLEAMSSHLMRAERFASIGTLTGAIGHELTAVVTELAAAIDPIRIDAAEGRAPSQDSLDRLSRTHNRLRLHASNLSSLGRPALQPDAGATDAKAAVIDVLGMLRAAGLLRQVRVQLDLPTGPLSVAIDRVAAERVLLNVIKNAVEAASEGRHADPTIAIAVEAREQDGTAACTIADNGAGIAAGNVALIFEPYFTTKAPEDGAGLGLFAARQILRNAGGEVTVATAPGHGATFTLVLPLAARPGMLAAAAPPAPRHARRA